MNPMSSFALPVLSNRHIEYQTQNILVRDQDGRLHFAPIRRAPTLPPEILAEIFIHCLPVSGLVTPDPAEPPLALCAICRWWREVALSTPRLWSSLLVDFDDMHVDLYRKWLLRARSAPLSISLKDWDEKEVLASVDPLLRTFVGLSRQWKNIEIDIGLDLACSIFPVDGDFPLLEHLSVSVHASDLSISFCEAPKLREVSILIYNPHIQVPWHQLTTFRTANISISGCIEILRNASNLLDGTFEVADDPPDVATPIVHHKSLQNLSLGAIIDQDPNVNPMPVLNFLNIPGLKKPHSRVQRLGYDGPRRCIAISIFHIPILCSTRHIGIIVHAGNDAGLDRMPESNTFH
ncbi:F-box domain-containing protein [Mycena venus]|uniref:F-box domain-containing protein n=1 Tax=Mycena venus TaxID=2733690 RepID=A0A8H6TZ20_9AGAR|nr:F-box domain-containing protein [Mycena venus]